MVNASPSKGRRGSLGDLGYKEAAQRLGRLFAANDDQGDGELELVEFRDLYRKVFPDRPMTESSWNYTQKLFQQIDIDNSGKISLEEIFLFLQESMEREKRLKKGPESAADWLYVVCCHGGLAWLEPEQGRLRAVLHIARSLEFLFTLIAVVAIMVISLPDYQRHGSPHVLRGTDATTGLLVVCLVAFVAHLVGHGYGFCCSKMRWLQREGEGREGGEKEEAVEPRSAVLAWVGSKVFFMGMLSIVGVVGYLIDTSSNHVYFLPLVSMRLVRIAKVLKLFEIATPQLTPALVKGAESLRVLCMLLLTQMCIAASFMFYAEVDQAHFDPALRKWVRDNTSDYPDHGEPIMFQSLLDCLWWSIVTITTVGYGDYYPVTIGGKIVAAVTMLGSLVLISYPITILNSTIEAIESERIDRETRKERNRELFKGLMEYLKNAEAEATQQRVQITNDSPALKPGSPAQASLPGTDPLASVTAMTQRLDAALERLLDRVHSIDAPGGGASTPQSPRESSRGRTRHPLLQMDPLRPSPHCENNNSASLSRDHPTSPTAGA